jgi:hypothetical protein
MPRNLLRGGVVGAWAKGFCRVVRKTYYKRRVKRGYVMIEVRRRMYIKTRFGYYYETIYDLQRRIKE